MVDRCGSEAPASDKTIYNVSIANDNYAYADRQTARNGVPTDKRGLGQILKYAIKPTGTKRIERNHLTMQNGKAVNPIWGNVFDNGGTMTVEINTEGYKYIDLQVVYGDQYGGAFFDADNTMISGFTSVKSELPSDLRRTIAIPDGAVRLLNTYLADDTAAGGGWGALDYVMLSTTQENIPLFEWVEEYYNGSNISGWNDDSNWQDAGKDVSKEIVKNIVQQEISDASLNYVTIHGGANWQMPLRGLEGAYSFRSLNMNNGRVATIRRVSDSATTDDLSALDEFQTTNGWSPLVCDTLVDQSLKGNDLKPYDAKSTPAVLPRLFRGKPAFSATHYLSPELFRGSKQVPLVGKKTIAVVFRAAGIVGNAAYGFIVSNYGGPNPYHGWAVGINANGNPTYWSSGHGAFIVDDSLNLIDGALHNIIVTHDGSILKVYVDGVLSIQSDSCQQNTEAYGLLTIGGNAEESPNMRFKGSIGELLLYSRAWSEGEVLAYTSNLNHYFGVDELIPISNEKSVRTLHGSYINAGQTLNFERTQAWTMYTAVQMLTGLGHAGIIFTNVSALGDPFYGYELFIDQYGRPSVRLINSVNSNWISIRANKSIADGNIHVVGVRYDGSSKASGVAIYVDGDEVTDRYIEGDNLRSTIVGGEQYLLIGNQYNHLDFFFTGILDDFRIDNVDRGAAYMEAMKTPFLIPPIDGNTQIAYNFENVDNGVIPDISGNNRNGTINNPKNIPFWVE